MKIPNSIKLGYTADVIINITFLVINYLSIDINISILLHLNEVTSG
jgi:hypothetical protein